MQQRSHEDLKRELETAKELVKIGGTYSHYKNHAHQVRVVAVGIQEATEKLCVVYQDIKNEKLIFVRDLDVWLEEPVAGTPRFKLATD